MFGWFGTSVTVYLGVVLCLFAFTLSEKCRIIFTDQYEFDIFSCNYLHEGSKCIMNMNHHLCHSFLLCDVLMWIYSIQHLNTLLSFVNWPCWSSEHYLFAPFIWKHLWLPIIHPCSVEVGLSCWTKVFKQHKKATSIISPVVVILQCMHHAWSASEWVWSLYQVLFLSVMGVLSCTGEDRGADSCRAGMVRLGESVAGPQGWLFFGWVPALGSKMFF